MINPNSSIGHKFILIGTYYFTRWAEAITSNNADQDTILIFLKKFITRFVILVVIVSDNAHAFISVKILEFAMKYSIIWKTSFNYDPQGNGLADSTIKNILINLKIIMEDNLR